MTPSPRSLRSEAEAETALADALIGLGFTLAPAAEGADLAVDLGAGRVVQLEVKGLANASPDRVAAQVRANEAPGHAVKVLVGDAIPERSRAYLDDALWGWFDRRGHIRVRASGLHVDADVEPQARRAPKGSRDAIVGRGGIAAALQLLMNPGKPFGVRKTATRANLNPSSISRAFAALRDHALVDRDGHPLRQDLFWELARVWPRVGNATKREVRPGDENADSLAMQVDHPDVAGWALSGTRGALAWGAPLVASGRQAPDLYVPSETEVRRSLQRYGRAPHPSAAATTLRLAPSSLVLRPRWRRRGEPWPVAHPVVVALDLAGDEARGAEILEAWDPPPPFHRVW